MKTNNKPDSLVAACFGMAASFLIIAALSGCGGGAGSGGIDSNNNNNNNNNSNAPDIANGTLSVDGNTYTISSFKNEFSLFSLIEKNDGAPQPASSANGTAIIGSDDTRTRSTEGTEYVDLNYISAPATAANSVGLSAEGNMGLNDWTPFRYLKFDVNTDASAFEGSVVMLSGDAWLWCDASGSVPAGTKGTLTLDLNTCGAAKLDPVYVRRVMLLVNSTAAAGHFYIDNVRLEKDTAPPPAVSDIADATTAPDGNTFTISSFRTGVGAFSLIENAPGGSIAAAPANVTATMDTVAAHATEGSQSVDVNFIAPAASLLGLKVDSSGLSDWTPFRYARFDVTTGATAYDGTVIVQSGTVAGGWNLWCDVSGSGNVPANSTGTITLDMDACGANINKATVQRLQLRIDGATTGHFYIDNVRLEKGAPAPVITDIADATTSVDGNTFTISSFASGLSSFVAIDDADNNVTATNATATQDTTATNATEGSNSAQLTVTALPTAGADPWIALASRSNGGLAAWSPYRYLRFSVKTGAAAFGGMAVVQSGASYNWCGGAWADIPAGSSADVTVDLTTCTGGDLADVRKFFVFTKSLGTFHIDNLRLTKN